MKKIIIVALIISWASQLKAQIDPHFSQYYAYPLYLNPALTGVFNGDLRVTGNFKNQYPEVNNAYQTGALSIDGRPTDKIGVGLNLLDQQSGGMGFNYFTAYGSFSYGITVSNDGYGKLNFGVQAGVINRSFNPSGAQYGNQYNPVTGFDPSMPSFESFTATNAMVFDAGTGIFYYDGNPLHIVNVFGGVSVTHLAHSKDNFAYQSSNFSTIPIRYTLHGGVRVNVSDSFDLMPHVIFMQQQKSQEKAVGAYSEMRFGVNSGLILGGMYRFKDASIVDVAYHLDNVIIGASYDFNTSSLNTATAGQGGMELSISYVFHKHINAPDPICPRL